MGDFRRRGKNHLRGRATANVLGRVGTWTRPKMRAAIMKALVPYLVFFLVGVALAYGQSTVTSREENKQYSVFLTRNGKTAAILQGLPKEPSIFQINERLFRITLSLGSPDSYTYFIDSSRELVEGPFFLFQVLNEKNLGILYVGSNGKLTGKLLFKRLDPVSFDLPDISPVAVVTNAITNIEFPSDASIRITYCSGSQYVKKQISVEWPRTK